MKPTKAIFLDRDGVLNRDIGYVYRIEDLEVLAGVPEALAQLKKAGYLLIVISNQAGIARGFYTMQDVDCFHQAMQSYLQKAAHVQIDAFYFCPHHPEAKIVQWQGPCSCRKPEIGMIKAAQANFSIDLSASYFVGDRKSDIECGIRAGVTSIQIDSDQYEAHQHPHYHCQDLNSAAQWILANQEKSGRLT